MISKYLIAAATGLLIVGAVETAKAADAREINIGYLQIVEPGKVAQASGTYEKDSGWKINWKRFDSGADILAAISSNAIQLAYIGSPPFAAASSREVPLQVFFVAGEIGDAEALVTRNGTGIAEPRDLIGKKVAVTFATTTHYSLLAALKHWNIDPKQVNIVNMRPPDIAAAWHRGDIDAAYVWNPILATVKADGKVLVSSAQVAQWGSPTLDLWMVRKDFAADNLEFVQSFVDTTERAYTRFQKEHASWTVSSPEVLAIGRVTGATPEEVLELLNGNYYPQPAEEASSRFLDGGTVKAIADTAAFLKTQDVIPHTLDDYSPYINARFVKNSKKSN